MRIVEFIVAGKPLAKGRVRFARASGRAYTPERTVSYEGQVAAAAQAAMQGRTPAEGPVSVRLEVGLPIPASWSARRQFQAELGLLRPTGRPDIDNYIKIVADALNLIAWNDDSQIVKVEASKRYSHNPGVKITVDAVLEHQ